jgi:hypothetical protein
MNLTFTITRFSEDTAKFQIENSESHTEAGRAFGSLFSLMGFLDLPSIKISIETESLEALKEALSKARYSGCAKQLKESINRYLDNISQ